MVLWMAPRPSPAVTLAAGLLPVPVPVSPRGDAEAGEVDRRVQIPIDWWASIAALIDAIPQGELGFRPAAGTQLSGRKGAWRDHERRLPYQAVLQSNWMRMRPNAASPSARLRPRLRAPPRRLRFVADSFSTATAWCRVARLVVACGSRGRGSFGHRGVDPPHPLRWPLPRVSTAPGESVVSGIVGTTPARGLPLQPRAAGDCAAGSTVAAPRCGRPPPRRGWRPPADP